MNHLSTNSTDTFYQWITKPSIFNQNIIHKYTCTKYIISIDDILSWRLWLEDSGVARGSSKIFYSLLLYIIDNVFL